MTVEMCCKQLPNLQAAFSASGCPTFPLPSGVLPNTREPPAAFYDQQEPALHRHPLRPQALGMAQQQLLKVLVPPGKEYLNTFLPARKVFCLHQARITSIVMQ